MTALNNTDTGDTSEMSGSIAIVGMATRLPGASDLAQFWTLLSNGTRAIKSFDDADLLAHGVDPQSLSDPNFISAKGYLPDVDMFDANFFGFSPREAALVDPQHRVMMEVAWQAMEHSGYDPEQWSGRCAIFTSAGMNTYLTFNIATNPGLIEQVGGFQLSIYNDKDFIPTRIAYALNSHGPAIDIGTACSSSLVGVHLACQHLLSYQSDLTLVGGVTIHLPQETGYLAQPGSAYSPDGYCRPFDASPSGLVDGNGAAAVVLKRLEDAIEDGDTIHAIIRGSAINNDGSDKVGYSAPSIQGQADVIREAQALAGVSADQISYVEAHGTATALGDPIEVAGLTEAFRDSTDRKGYCGLGSVKSNIGHVDKAAGLAGLIKTALALKHEAIPANLHWQAPNPKLNLPDTPFYIVDRLTDWPAQPNTPRIAAISSFGVGGTNSHAILQEAPVQTVAQDHNQDTDTAHLLVLSAKTPAALEQVQARLHTHLQNTPNLDLGDVAYTLTVGRKRMPWRTTLVCQNIEQACSRLAEPSPGLKHSASQREAVFMFSGQGTQHALMGQALYASEPVYRQHIDQCALWLEPLLGCDLRTLLYPAPEQLSQANESLKQTSLAQPALFVTEYALAQLWMHWGVQPTAVLGHSLGEYVAACIAGVFGLEDALRLVAERGRLMQTMPEGAMLAVSLPSSELTTLLESSHRDLNIAAINGASQCVVSGPIQAIESLQATLQNQSVMVRTLQTSHAFHSHMMQPMLADFAQTLASVTLNAPGIPIISNVTGQWCDPSLMTHPQYWLDHIRQPVQFYDSLRCLSQHSATAVWIEVGPGRVLSSLAGLVTRAIDSPAPIASLPPAQSTINAQVFMREALGQWWALGGQFDIHACQHGRSARRIPLPTYPFERDRFWIEPGHHARADSRYGLEQRQAHPANWFYHQDWRTQSLNTLTTDESIRMVLLTGKHPLLDPLSLSLQASGRQVYTDLAAMPTAPDLVVYLVDRAHAEETDKSFEVCKPLLDLSKQLLGTASHQPIKLCVVGEQMLAIGASDAQVPAKAALVGLLRTLPYEYTEIDCQAIDVPALADSRVYARLAGQIALECLQAEPCESVVLRTGSRWVPTLSAEVIDRMAPEQATTQGLIKPNTSYLLLGGVSDIGLVMAAAILRAGAQHIVLSSAGGESEISPAHETQINAWREMFDAQIEVEHLPAFSAAEITALIARTQDLAYPLCGVIDATDMHADKPIGLVQALEDAPLHAYWQNQRDHLHELAAALEPQAIEYCLVMSSLAAYTGGTGQLASTVAGLYTQAFAQQQNQKQGMAWFVAHWDVWSQTDPDAISPKDGEMAMSYLLSLASPGLVMITPRSPQAKREQVRSAKQNKSNPGPTAIDNRHERPNISTPWVAPETEQQVAIAQLWERFLGIKTVGLDDDFFELGGNSLLAAQLLLEIKDQFRVAIDFTQFFTGANVRALSEVIVAAQVSASSPEALVEQLNIIEQLSDEQVQAMLDKGDLPPEILDLLRQEDH